MSGVIVLLLLLGIFIAIWVYEKYKTKKLLLRLNKMLENAISDSL